MTQFSIVKYEWMKLVRMPIVLVGYAFIPWLTAMFPSQVILIATIAIAVPMCYLHLYGRGDQVHVTLPIKWSTVVKGHALSVLALLPYPVLLATSLAEGGVTLDYNFVTLISWQFMGWMSLCRILYYEPRSLLESNTVTTLFILLLMFLSGSQDTTLKYTLIDVGMALGFLYYIIWAGPMEVAETE
ncbi:MAG: hypothetical protein ACRC5C_08015 [Bacilli bacterium]